jgi:hypothetical protein
MKRLLLSIAAIALLTRCAPARATSQLMVTPTEAMRCAANTLGSLGYVVTDERAVDGVLQGERDKHARAPYRGATDWDRITVSLSTDEKHSAIHVIGETLHSGSPTSRMSPAIGRMPDSRYEGQPVARAASREVREETKRIADTCAGVTAAESGSGSEAPRDGGT